MTTLTAPETGYKYGTRQDVTILDCARCGLTFGITTAFEKRRREDHKAFYCPNGHPNAYSGESEGERAKRLLKWARDDASRHAAERDQARADARAQKAAKTRIKNQRDRERTRVANGVCPCCNRTFENLGRHMATKHPDHATPDKEPS